MFCVFHEWPGDHTFFLADTREEAQRVVITIARDRIAGREEDEWTELEQETIDAINGADVALALQAVEDFCQIADESLEIHMITKYFSGSSADEVRS